MRRHSATNLAVPFRARGIAAPAALLTIFLIATQATAQLRIVSYNTAEDVRPEMSIILESIGEASRNGIAKPIDILALQEQTTQLAVVEGQVTQVWLSPAEIVGILNGIYGAGVYDHGDLVPDTNGSGRTAVVYNTNTVQLIGESVASTLSGSGAARQTARYQFRPVGYDASADFYLYNSHYKASQGSTNEARRDVEATQVRANADALGEGASLIYAGDLNLYNSSEDAYQTLLDSGPGQANDPLNPNNSTQFWNNSSGFATFHTQSPCSSSTGNCGVGGGVDSRFDFQLLSGELIDDEGMSLIDGSYHPFGNNGSTYNQSINSGSNTVTFPGVTSYTKSQILNALHTATDHLPLVADYQVPAVMEAILASVPATLEQGEFFLLDLSVFNDADVVAANGADELDYSLGNSGDVFVFGSSSGTDPALGGGNVHQFVFDTSTAGMKSGEITVTATSQSAQNAFLSFEFDFEVIAPVLAGDYNDDGLVDAADYTAWRDALELSGTIENETASPGVIDSADYDEWVANYGSAASLSVAVPEPASVVLLAASLLLGAAGRRC